MAVTTCQIRRRCACDIVGDLEDLNSRMGESADVTASMSPEVRAAYWQFRLDLLAEELRETVEASAAGDAAAVVDGLVDLVVVAVRTAQVFGVDFREAWRRVHLTNMVKSPGATEGRPNQFGLPDMSKPEGWVAPKHDDNVGLVEGVLCR